MYTNSFKHVQHMYISIYIQGVPYSLYDLFIQDDSQRTPNIDTCITGEIGCVVLNKRSRVRAEIMLRSVPKLILESSSMLAYTANYI